MPFEVFNRKTAGRTTKPMITIQKGGSLSLNHAALMLLTGGAELEELPVELLYDRENQLIGLRRSDGSPHEYVIRKQANSASFIVAGRAFTEHYAIDTTEARRYIAKMIEGGILAIDLNSPHVTVTRRARRN